MPDTIIPKTEPEAQAPSSTEVEKKDIPEARIVTEKKRSIEVPIEWPVNYKGKTYKSITVGRVTGLELQKYFEAMEQADYNDVLPPFVKVPKAVWDALDADDQYEVDQKAQPFTPRRLLSAAGLDPEPTENTSD